MSMAESDLTVQWQDVVRDTARVLAEQVDEMFTRHWPGGSVQRKAAIEVLLRDTFLKKGIGVVYVSQGQ